MFLHTHPLGTPQTQNTDDARAWRAQQTRSDLLPTPYYNQLTSDTDRYVGYMTVASVTLPLPMDEIPRLKFLRGEESTVHPVDSGRLRWTVDCVVDW